LASAHRIESSASLPSSTVIPLKSMASAFASSE
jgi:hypothetical protein